MSEVLAELTARYAPPERTGLSGGGGSSPQPPRRRATRTYRGAALARRKAWGSEWGSIQRQLATELRERG